MRLFLGLVLLFGSAAFFRVLLRFVFFVFLARVSARILALQFRIAEVNAAPSCAYKFLITMMLGATLTRSAGIYAVCKPCTLPYTATAQERTMAKNWWKNYEERERNPRFLTKNMLTRDERENHEGARINGWLALADKLLGNSDDDDPEPSAA